jgi:xanthine dehydrogenase/oxidase
MVSFWDYQEQKALSLSINSCLAPACAMHLKHITTIEGLGTTKNMHPVQEVFSLFYTTRSLPMPTALSAGSVRRELSCHSMQVYRLSSLLKIAELSTNPHATKHDIEDAFDGNLCRCTGYRPILDGAKSLVCSGDCSSCPSKDMCEHDMEDIGKKKKFYPACPFPQELKALHSSLSGPQSFVFALEDFQWIHPATKVELVQLKTRFPDAKIINGNTEIGIEVRFKNQRYPVYINTGDIDELKYLKVNGMNIA